MTTANRRPGTPPVAPGVNFHDCRDAGQWAWGAAVAISAALRRALASQSRARLLVSGGHTPAPVFAALSRAPIDWPRIDIALVDERWLLPEDSDSNAHLVRTQLLQHHAAAARFEPLTRAGLGIERAVEAANLHARQAPDVLLLGMGGDGHTASLFPHMRGLEAALASEQDYIAVDAAGCPGAGPWPRRISMTPAGLARAQLRLLLIRGDDKRAVFERALSGIDPRQYPIRIAFAESETPLQVYWCP